MTTQMVQRCIVLFENGTIRQRIVCPFAMILFMATATGTGSAPTGLNGGFAIDGDSWTFGLSFGSDGSTFDAFEFFIIADTGAGPFQNDGMFDFNQPGWTASAPNPLYTVATGPAFDSGIGWTFDFAGNMADTVTIDALFWNGGVFGSLDFAATFSFVNGEFGGLVQSFGGPYDFLQHPDGVGYNRSPPTPACPWDLDGDGNVFVTDLLLLLMDFGSCDGSPADFDGDGCVTVVDLLTLLFNFGPCPDGGCPWDVNGDGTVDQTDLWQVLGNLGPCDGCPEDVNGDGVVDFEDVIAVATHFGPCP